MEINVEETNVMRISRQPSPVQIIIDQKQLENVEYLNYLCSSITNGGRGTHEIKCGISMAKAVFKNKKNTFFTRKLGLNLKKKLINCYILSIPLYIAETWTSKSRSEIPVKFRNVVLEKISWTDLMKNETIIT
jgi:hypothetical protein